MQPAPESLQNRKARAEAALDKAGAEDTSQVMPRPALQAFADTQTLDR